MKVLFGITAWCFCCLATNSKIEQKIWTGQQETLCLYSIDKF